MFKQEFILTCFTIGEARKKKTKLNELQHNRVRKIFYVHHYIFTSTVIKLPAETSENIFTSSILTTSITYMFAFLSRKNDVMIAQALHKLSHHVNVIFLGYSYLNQALDGRVPFFNVALLLFSC